MSKIPLTPANLPRGIAPMPVFLLANFGLNSPVLVSQYFHIAHCVLPIHTKISSSVSRIFSALRLCGVVMWTAYGQVCAQIGKVIRAVSTLPTELSLSSQIVQSYTQFCMRTTAGVSTIKSVFFTTVNYRDIHIVHLAYNYNYIYIKKGY